MEYRTVGQFAEQVFQGKTIGRILFNKQAQSSCLDVTGKVLDLASGGCSDYLSYLPKDVLLTKADAFCGDELVNVDFNKALPFSASAFDGVLLFNAIYIAEDRVATLKEIFRVLKNDGVLLLSTPLIYGEIPEPVDYCRLTYQGLEREFRLAGFSRIEIIRYGERFTSAALLLHPVFFFNVVRYFVYGACVILDELIPKNFKAHHPAPCGYFCLVRK